MSAPRSLLAVACITALAALLPAQDQELPLPVPALRVHTRDLGLIGQLQDLLLAPRHDYALPADTGYCVFTVRPDGNVEQTTARGLLRPGTHAEFFLKPKVALGAWEHELAEVRRILLPRLDALCVQFGYPQGFGRRLWSDAQTALAQCSGICLRVDGDIRALEGVTCTLALVPEPDTALHRWLKALAPGPKGPLPLPEDGAAARLQLSLQPDRLRAIAEPFARFVIESGAGGAEERQARQDDFDRDLELWDGTLSLQVDHSAMAVFVGTRQPEVSAKLLADPTRLQREQESYERRRIQLSFKHAALRHRGVDALAVEAVTDLPTGELPAAMSSYRAIAGGCKVIVGAAKLPAEAMRAAIDRCLDGKAPGPLSGNALLLVDLDTDLIRAMLPSGMTGRGDAPDRRIRLAMRVTGITLELTLELR